MKNQYDFKKEWIRTKKTMMQLSKEAIKAAQKGEKELIEISKRGKIHFDSTAAGLKMEHLYYLIGKEYAKLKSPTKPTLKLQKLVSDLHKIEIEQKKLKRKLVPTKKKKVVKRKSAK